MTRDLIQEHRPYEDKDEYSTSSLLLRRAIFDSMSKGTANKHLMPFIEEKVLKDGGENFWNSPLVRRICAFIASHTVAKIFFGGVGEEQNMETARGLRKKNIGFIFDYAAPEDTSALSAEKFDRVRDNYLRSVEICKELRKEDPRPDDEKTEVAAAFKFSTIADYHDLKRISEKLTRKEALGADAPIFDEIQDRARAFFKAAEDAGIRAYADAEESTINPAIYKICENLRAEGYHPAITVQAYLKNADKIVDELCRMENPPDVKLVRGAYLKEPEEIEALIAKKGESARYEPRENIWNTKKETDECYNRCLVKMFERGKFETITVATHNEESREEAMRLARIQKSGNNTKLIFATLLGMGGNLPPAPAELNIPEVKYLPALLDEAAEAVLSSIAYFGRRAKEFMSVLDGEKTRAQAEIEEIDKELARRGVPENVVKGACDKMDKTLRRVMRLIGSGQGQQQGMGA